MSRLSSALSRILSCAEASTSACTEGLRCISTTATNLRLLRSPLPPQPPPDTLEGEEKPDLVAQFLSLENASRGEHTRHRLHQVMADFQRFRGDTGSSEVQVAVLTEKIKILAEHLTVHRKDHSSRRGLQAMLAQRRSLLQYLRGTQFDTYVALISRLGLKDHAPQDRLSVRYKPAVPKPGARPTQ